MDGSEFSETDFAADLTGMFVAGGFIIGANVVFVGISGKWIDVMPSLF